MMNAAKYETRDLRLRPIIIFALVLGLVIGLALFLMWDLFDDFAAARRRAVESPVPIAVSELPPEPRLQVEPAKDLEALRAAEDRLLNRYEWLDRQQGLLRIPIEQAMKRVTEKTGRKGAEDDKP